MIKVRDVIDAMEGPARWLTCCTVDNLSSSPGTHLKVEGENHLHKIVMHCGMCRHNHNMYI